MDQEKYDLSSLTIDESKRDRGRPPGANKRLLGWIAALIILALVGYFGYGAVTSFFTPETAVSLTRATLQSAAQSNSVLNANGYVVAQRKASVASKGTGRLVFLGVVEGDEVTADQVIARLEDNDIRAQVAEARANLKLQQAELYDAQTNRDRQRTLYESGSTSAATRASSPATTG